MLSYNTSNAHVYDLIDNAQQLLKHAKTLNLHSTVVPVGHQLDTLIQAQLCIHKAITTLSKDNPLGTLDAILVKVFAEYIKGES